MTLIKYSTAALTSTALLFNYLSQSAGFGSTLNVIVH